jgi:glycerophosphoryl diester phosphodiesterase
MAVTGCAHPVNKPTENINLNVCLKNSECSEKLSVAHRGTGSFSLWAPENTLAAFDIAWKMGADSIEIDVRQTSDGELIIMHDETVDRTTDGTGKVSVLTLEQIKSLNIKSCSRGVPDQKVPTLHETLSFLKGKTLVYVDVKTTDYEKMIGVFEEEEMLDSSYFLIYSIADGYMARMQNAFVALMPAVNTIDQAREYINSLSPVVMFELEYKDATPELVGFIHSKGIKIHMDALGFYDILGKWGFSIMLQKGTDSIQSDRIDILVPYLKSLHDK